MSTSGVTLVEILVALTVLAVGATGLVGWQLGIAHLAMRAQDTQRVLEAASTELGRRLLTTAFTEPHCAGDDDRVICSATEEACFASGALLHCGGPVTPATRVRRITVEASSTRTGADVRLETTAAPFRQQDATAPGAAPVAGEGP